jgi:hypothetical protein
MIMTSSQTSGKPRSSKMYKSSRVVFLLVLASLVAPGVGLARDPVEVNYNALTREFCHVVRFPLGWQMFPDEKYGLQPPSKYSFDNGDYEFRVPGLLGTRFLVRGFVPDLSKRDYTMNLYAVDLSDPRAVAQPASEEEWNSATVLQLRYTGQAEALFTYIRSLGFQFAPSGDHGQGGRLSPDRAVWILHSWKGTLGGSGGSDVPGDFSIHWPFGNSHGKLFFDAYSTSTGKKLLTVSANFSIILPETAFEKTGWVTERYFIIPLDERQLRFLVCDFGKIR